MIICFASCSWIILFLSSKTRLSNALDKDKLIDVQTKCALIRGIKSPDYGVYAFKGIPYAKPPIRELRWKKPVPLSTVNGSCHKEAHVIVADKFGNMCVQRGLNSYSGITGSEDCLYLNVWTPNVDRNAKLPVMVWIHGGSLMEMSGDFPTYSPSEEVALKTNMVYVSMNYRLNVFGFLALSYPFNITGNYGFMDQQMALQWVQENIINFGGDPDIVTVFGQSSGATSIMALLASPQSVGLFQRAWLMSGSALLNITTQMAATGNEIFLKNTGCRDENCLANLPAKKLMQAIPLYEYPYWDGKDLNDLPTRNLFVGAIAVIDGDVLPMSPFDAWRNGKGVDVPLLVGSTAQEIDYDPTPKDLASWTWNRYEKIVTKKMSTFPALNLSKVLDMYPKGAISPEFQFTTMVTDIRITCPVDVMTYIAKCTYKSPVYRYVVTAYPSKPFNYYGINFKAKYSAHGLDIFAFFNTLKDYYSVNDNDMKLTEIFRKEIVHFAKTGCPYTSSWQTFPAKTAIVNGGISIVDQYHKEECAFWAKEGLLSYSWIN